MEIEQQLEMIVTEIKDQFGSQVDFIVLFGSYSTGNSLPLSDIDIGVHVSNPEKKLDVIFGELLSLFDYVDKKRYPKIDATLLNLATVSLSLLYRVVRDGKVLYRKDEEVWPCFVEYVLSRYPDWHYYIENYLKQSLGGERE